MESDWGDIASGAKFGAFLGFIVGLIMALQASWTMDSLGFSSGMLVALLVGPIVGAIAGGIFVILLSIVLIPIVLIGNILFEIPWQVYVFIIIVAAIVCVFLEWHPIFQFIGGMGRNIIGLITVFGQDVMELITSFNLRGLIEMIKDILFALAGPIIGMIMIIVVVIGALIWLKLTE